MRSPLILQLLLLYLTVSLKNMTYGDVILDCGNSNNSCPHTKITLKCTVTANSLGWDLPVNNQKIRFFEGIDPVGLIIHRTQFTGTLVISENDHTMSTLTFSSSSIPEGSEIQCDGIPVTSVKSCVVSIQDPPPPPTNLIIQTDLYSSMLQLSWSAPIDIDSDTLQYQVFVTPPINNDPIVTTSNNLTVNISSYEVDVQYTVTVTTTVCNGSLLGNSSINGTFTLSPPPPAESSTPTITTPHPSSTSIHTTISIVTIQHKPHTITSMQSSVLTVLPSTTTISSRIRATLGSATPTRSATTLEIPNKWRDLDSTNDDNTDNQFLIISFVVGGLLVLVAIIVFMVVFSIIIIVIVKKVTNNRDMSSCCSHPNSTQPTRAKSMCSDSAVTTTSTTCTCPHSNDSTVNTSSNHAKTSSSNHPNPNPEQSVVALNNSLMPPPALPPKPKKHIYENTFELRCINGGHNLYDDLQNFQNSQSVEHYNVNDSPSDATSGYAIPIVARVFVHGNSNMTFV